MRGAAPSPPDRARVGGIVAASRSVLDGAKDLARRSHRLSWICWGFLYAAWGGVVLLTLLALVYPNWSATLESGGGLGMTSSPPLVDLPLAFAPAIALFCWALRELFASRRAARAAIRGTAANGRAPSAGDVAPGWTQQVVDAQKLLTAAKLETDWSFLPLGIGLLGVDSTVTVALNPILGGPFSNAPYFVVGVGAVAFCMALYFLYRVAESWIGGFQQHLDLQVRAVSALEAEFLWRFAGSPA
ncbi:MAG TPA: hypothetical protein VMC82_06205 [Thermoplasmata archaeon]|nr:hypothetical protein [Thermoplasmata archaeon]